jgi:[ribosomal protein S5]-alanine N-acetyltransferase
MMSNNIQLKPLQLSDAERFALLANNPNISKNVTDQFPHPYTIDNAIQFITSTLEKNPIQVMGIFYNNELCGGIGIHPQHDIYKMNAELGYWLGEPYWGKGIGTTAVLQMVAYSFAQFDINRIFARPFGSNIGSQKVLQKAGFILEATLIDTIYKNGRYENELIYAIRRNA